MGVGGCLLELTGTPRPCLKCLGLQKSCTSHFQGLSALQVCRVAARRRVLLAHTRTFTVRAEAKAVKGQGVGCKGMKGLPFALLHWSLLGLARGLLPAPPSCTLGDLRPQRPRRREEGPAVRREGSCCRCRYSPAGGSAGAGKRLPGPGLPAPSWLQQVQPLTLRKCRLHRKRCCCLTGARPFTVHRAPSQYLLCPLEQPCPEEEETQAEASCGM